MIPKRSTPSTMEGVPFEYKEGATTIQTNPPELLNLKFGEKSYTLSVTWWRSWQRTGVWQLGHLKSLYFMFVLLFTLLTRISATSGIIQEFTPNLVVKSDELVSQSFHGNQSHVDYFRLLQRDGDSLLIGARNYVYNISIIDLSEHLSRRIEWISRKSDSNLCFDKGKSEAECHNYIRVLAKKSEGEFLVCGTNAYKPTCRDYTLQENGSFTYDESSGVGKCPYNPRHNSTFVFADGHLYSGTVVDFQGMIPLIFRDPLKTEPSDYKQLNGPDFVHSFEYGDYVFFFFRETAVEYMNCGKRVYSRVARVCKSDQGVEQQRFQAMSIWTTFLKSRLNCSFPGDYPFYFDEIQSVSDVVLGVYGGINNEVIYAIFTTPQNSIPGSAVCSFSMRDVLDTFEGPFKEQKDHNSNWMAVPLSRVPEPRPGICVNDSRTLPQENINFIRSHPLMDDLVSPFHGRPLLMKASFEYRFTKLTVDPQVPISSGAFVDVIFIATDIGMILKVINAPSEENDRQVTPIIVEEIHVFETPVLINNLQIAKQSDGDSKLVIITDIEVKAIPLQRCHKAASCRECIALQDPYCAWYPVLGICESTQNSENQNYLQNVSSGFHQLCPIDVEPSLLKSSTPNHISTTETTQPPEQEVLDTCPPCVCAEQPTTPIAPSTPQKRPLSSTHDSREEETIELVTVPDGILQENEIESPLRPVVHKETNYITKNLPIAPRVPQGRARPDVYPKRGGKELPIGIIPPPQRELNEVSIAYSEGVTGPVVGASLGGPLIYSAETLAIAVTTACVAALVIGFISGFLFSRKCRGDDYPAFSETPYLDSKLNKCENSADPNMYTANNASLPPKQINNLVTNYNPKNINAGKANTNADTKLIKQAKCAYI
ncbi:UNVERIFIED_CONTAM: hypothetical protein RMT77_010562 [Armadillidium vulgare]